MVNTDISALSITPIARHIRREESPTNGQKTQKTFKNNTGLPLVFCMP